MPSFSFIVYRKGREKSARAGRRVLGGTMAFVEFADVSKIYQMGEVEVAAVRDMSFTIEQGEFVVIVGPSGAGKTTLLNMLGGMDSATSGTIMLDGARVSSFNRKQLTQYRRHDIGFVFQFYNLVQNLTARENVELASQICRDPLDADEVLVTSSTKLCMSADEIDGRPVGGKAPELLKRIQDAVKSEFLEETATAD